MDKVRTMITVLKKYHFWVLLAVVVLLSVGMEYLCSSSLAETKTNNEKEIDSKISSMNSIKSQRNLPNKEVVDGMIAHNQKRRKEIYRVWNQKWERQKPILKWPAVLEKKFVAKVDKLRPIEEKVAWEPDAQKRAAAEKLGEDLRAQYVNNISTALPRLAEAIGSTWAPNAKGKQPVVRSEDTEEKKDVVIWDVTNQSEIVDTHFDFTEVPSTLEILYVQEDLWVLSAIVGIIKDTNGNIDAHHDAAVRQIYSIEIGQNATGTVGTIFVPVPTDPKAAAATPAAAPLENMDSVATDTGDPAEGRYVDGNYRAVAASKIRGALTSKDPKDAELAVAKRMPVRLRLRIDQRQLNNLLVACGNADLMLEVRQVRINPNGSTAPSRSQPRGGGDGFGGGFGGGHGGGEAPRTNTRSSSDNAFPHDVDVEIYGIVFIYNPVSPDALGFEENDPFLAKAAGGRPAVESEASKETEAGDSDAPAATTATPPVDSSAGTEKAGVIE